MEILEKVRVNPNICRIQLDFAGALSPEAASSIQNFYNSRGVDNIWNDAYFGKKRVSFRETSKSSKSGLSFTQVLEIKFPSNDSNRSDRISLFEKVKYVKLILDNGNTMVIGRNDYFQNKLPDVSITSDEMITTVKFETKSIFSIGFVDAAGAGTNDFFNDLLPHDIPITFINI
jgi:hypothetical protein